MISYILYRGWYKKVLSNHIHKKISSSLVEHGKESNSKSQISDEGENKKDCERISSMRGSLLKVVCEKSVLRNFVKSKRKHLQCVLF